MNGFLIWGTLAELKFIAGLGRWSAKGMDRVEALSAYIKSSERRGNWHGIDREEVLDRARRSLEAEVVRRERMAA